MRVPFFERVVSACAVAAMLSGCGASLPQGSGSRELALTLPATMLPSHGRSWMDPNAARWDLLYVSNGDGVVNVYRYWQQKLVGILTDFTYPVGECVDASGDVYITDFRANEVVEYAHGGTKPIDTIDVSPYSPYGCAVDRHNGNLAVANYRKGSYADGNVAIYRHGKGKPLYYTDRELRVYKSCAYDDDGDLLVTDGDYSSSFYGSGFAYLGKHSVKLVTVDISGGSSYGSGFNGVIGIAWDGKYWVLNTDAYGGGIYRIVIKGTSGHPVGSTIISGGQNLGPIWIYNNHKTSQGTQLVAAWTNYRSQNAVGYWKYPAGGSMIAEITKDLAEPYGVAVSLKTAGDDGR